MLTISFLYPAGNLPSTPELMLQLDDSVLEYSQSTPPHPSLIGYKNISTPQSVGTPSPGSTPGNADVAPDTTPLPIPEFSLTVAKGLKEKNTTPIWRQMIEEMQAFYLNKYPLRCHKSSDYYQIGRDMVAMYPSVARHGTNKWVSYLYTYIICEVAIVCGW